MFSLDIPLSISLREQISRKSMLSFSFSQKTKIAGKTGSFESVLLLENADYS